MIASLRKENTSRVQYYILIFIIDLEVIYQTRVGVF